MEFEKTGLYYFKPDQNGWYLLGHPSAKINNVGARGQNVDVIRINNKRKFIFLGDSFTFGWMLAESQTIPHIFMEEMNLTPEEVLNYGNGGFGIEHMEAMYLKYQDLFDPEDTLIVILPQFDFYRLLKPYRKEVLKEIFWKIREKSSFISWTYVILRNAYFHWVPPPAQEFSAERTTPLTSEVIEEHLSQLIDLAKENKQKIVFVFYEFEKSNYSEIAEAFCGSRKMACMTDIWRHAEKLKQKGEIIYASDKAHPSSALNQAIGKAITQFVRHNFSTPP